MAELAKKLHLKKGTTEHIAKAYSTTAEAGAEYITNKIDGVTAYAPIGATNDSRATMGRVKKSGSTEKAILTMGKPPYTKKQWTTPGTYTFTVPQGIANIKVTLAGAGGGGGDGVYHALGGAGGRGELITQNIAVISGTSYSLTVAKGGTAGGDGRGYINKKYTEGVWHYTESRGNGGTDGGNSIFDNTHISRGGGGGYGGFYQRAEGSEGSETYKHNGNTGTSYGNGGQGGNGGPDVSNTFGKGTNGQNGWIIIEYGGDI